MEECTQDGGREKSMEDMKEKLRNVGKVIRSNIIQLIREDNERRGNSFRVTADTIFVRHKSIH